MLFGNTNYQKRPIKEGSRYDLPNYKDYKNYKVTINKVSQLCYVTKQSIKLPSVEKFRW